jgi:hypothetical protein
MEEASEMKTTYQARWVSKARAERLKRSGEIKKGMLLDSFNGFIVIEPPGIELGDGKVLSHQEADFEMQTVWVQESKTKLSEARRLLGLEAEPADLALAI